MHAAILLLVVVAATDVSITQPQDGGVYDSCSLSLSAIVQNENILPDSVTYSLNGEQFVPVPRLVTDWYTYMANECRTGYSESPAPHDNTVMWTAAVTGTEHEFATPVVVDGRVYYNSSWDCIAYCLDAATGEEIWRFDEMDYYPDDGMHVQDGLAFLAADSVYCLDALTGEKQWAFQPDSATIPILNGPPLPLAGKVFFNYGHIFALDIATGLEIWSAEDEYGSTSTLSVWNGLILCPTQYGLAAFYAETGDPAWFFEGGGFWDSSPCVVGGIIYIGSVFDECLFAIDASDGSLVWQSMPLGDITSTPSYHDDRVFSGVGAGLDYPGSIFALNSDTGAIEWQYFIPEEGNWLHGSVGVADGLVFWGQATSTEDSTAMIRALDEETGQEVWSFETESGGSMMGLVGSPAITDGVMYIAGADSNLYAFGTGLKWTYRDDLYADVGANELIVDSWSGGTVAASDTIQFMVTQTGIVTDPSGPSRPVLTIRPNPFTSSATVSFELDSPCWSSLRVFDITGRLVGTIQNGESQAGSHNLSWGGTEDSGERLPSGIYTLVLSSPWGDVTETVCLLR